MASRIKLFVILSILFFQIPCYAGQKYNSRFGGMDFCSTFRSGSVINDNCSDIQMSGGSLTKSGNVYLIRVPYLPSGAVSLTTSQTTISPSYSLVRKAITSAVGFTTGTMANGTPGQTITILITAGTGSYTLVPATKTGFASVVFDAVFDMATFQYIDDTIGWILISSTNLTINL